MLSPREERNLEASLPALRKWAEGNGCIKKALDDWSRDEVLQFLQIAVKAVTFHHSADLNDEIPF